MRDGVGATDGVGGNGGSGATDGVAANGPVGARDGLTSGMGFEALLPGDDLDLGSGDRARVEALFRCEERIGAMIFIWSWSALADGRLFEVAPRGCALYAPPTRLPRDGVPYLGLVAQDGLLVRFEQRVRAGTWTARPVHLTLEGRRWRVSSTGTMSARRLGDAPASCWGQLGMPTPAEEPTVYFTLAAPDDPDTVGLGLWATDICLGFGRRLGQTPADAGIRVVRRDDRPPAGG